MKNNRNLFLILSLISFLLSFSLSSSAQTFNFFLPEATTPSGQQNLFYVNFINGRQFCQEQGFSHMIGGSIACVEEEDFFMNYDIIQQRWESTFSGSSSACYPVFGSITCGRLSDVNYIR